HRRRPRPLHRPEPVAEPLRGRAVDRQAQLDVPLRLGKRPEDHLLPAVAPRDPDPAGDRHRRAGLLRERHRKPRDLRGLPVTTLLDPGMDLTLRPMRYPHFYDRFRDAIRNTWTV